MQKQLGNPVQYTGKRFLPIHRKIFSLIPQSYVVQFTTFSKHTMHRGVFSSLSRFEISNSDATDTGFSASEGYTVFPVERLLVGRWPASVGCLCAFERSWYAREF